MTEAEKHLKNIERNEVITWTNIDDLESSEFYTKEEVLQIMESHHQSRINSISDEIIEELAELNRNELKDNTPLSNGFYLGYKECWNYVKQKLPNK